MSRGKHPGDFGTAIDVASPSFSPTSASPLRRAIFRLHPARAVAVAFAVAVALGTALLALPLATADGGAPDPLTALFTATAAVCVTGLTIVDTSAYWSGFGEGVILLLVQAGGFGIMSLASLLALLVAGKLRLRMTLHAQAETRIGIGDVRGVLLRVALITLVVESVTAAILTLRFVLGYDMPFGRALYYGVFHAVAAFNNSGHGLRSDNLTAFAADPWVLVPVSVAVILGGLGFPVIIELLHQYARRRRGEAARGWSLHLKLTLIVSGALLAVGFALTLGLEWSNEGTFGPLAAEDKMLGAFFHSAVSRTAGFNATDIAAMEPATLLATNVLMFIGGGSAGTAGGIKVTTFAVLAVAILAEVRGEPTSGVFRRKLAPHVLRQALTVALLGVGVVMVSTVALLAMVDARTDLVLFETVSVFSTVGMTTGLTADLPTPAQLIVIFLMFIGRVGPITLVSALALRERTRRYQHPEERPIIG
ncbi:TrkH family potassium uptake protein [Streptomyces marincola]|uniref:TrkH family potassium uptake protein n=1 Tax=Streptomyces marincola TaxID=2878388 RepID=UPI001CF49A22|nr:potassium transporter TrkG [Streptomyces marincola]UCM88234.1 TrkH family potassium uptake protein [Streptomyces marincola]